MATNHPVIIQMFFKRRTKAYLFKHFQDGLAALFFISNVMDC